MGDAPEIDAARVPISVLDFLAQQKIKVAAAIGFA
jgi:hypothetical protein